MYGPTDLNELLFHLRAPRIKRLHLRSLEDLGYRQQPIAPSLLRFLARSAPSSFTEESDLAALDPSPSPSTQEPLDAADLGTGAVPLELLELHDIDLAPEAFAAAFRALPHLRELRLHESSISDGTLRVLHGPHGFCPRLTRVDFRWCGHLGGKALVELVRSRLPRAEAQDEDSTAGIGIEVLHSGSAAASASAGEGSGPADPIEEVAAINCCFVEEQDVLELARLTTCRVLMREADEDYCRTSSFSPYSTNCAR
ncbi:hypothetical protein EVJ58_g7855 [Rhodofomes roseus]|uniref:Leucine rich repeat (LRR) protein n=1 Tax=Rhodofomes roseus TaxID=34475 RepID=A0A4Y9Y2S5_9APHY|nr:hypothetical protein EVJ58_g7855 [Rhodofomes roseus]